MLPPPSGPTENSGSLPAFRYHPDPLATGSVIRSDARCVCCGDARGYVCAGPVHAVVGRGRASGVGRRPSS
ncbi:CbrC family protein [Burkholderia sp. S-53]|uniref:CbrC family protein n=1 Tax=Burkholderia sp. S-53 TaxID=2906514 RepID=UPI00399A8BF9